MSLIAQHCEAPLPYAVAIVISLLFVGQETLTQTKRALIYHKHTAVIQTLTMKLCNSALIFIAINIAFLWLPVSVSLRELLLAKCFPCNFSIMKSLFFSHFTSFISTLHNGVKVNSLSNSAYMAYSQIPRLHQPWRSLILRNAASVQTESIFKFSKRVLEYFKVMHPYNSHLAKRVWETATDGGMDRQNHLSGKLTWAR